MRAYLTIGSRHATMFQATPFGTTPFGDDAINWMLARTCVPVSDARCGLQIEFLLSPVEHQSEADTVVVEAVARMSEKELNVHVGHVLHH